MKVLLALAGGDHREYLCTGPVESGFSVEQVDDGREALNRILYCAFDVIILGRQIPGMDGRNVLKAMRAALHNTPVMIIADNIDVSDQVDLLMEGADDYVAEPVQFSELLARVMVLARRNTSSAEEELILRFHDLELDLLKRTARRGDRLIDLTAKEFALLEILMRHTGRVFSRTLLLERVWGIHFDPGTTIVESHISRLRKKIDKPFTESLINTKRNLGYTMQLPSRLSSEVSDISKTSEIPEIPAA